MKNMNSNNVVTSLKIDVEHFPGTVKTKKATIYVTNHKTGEAQVIECQNNTEAMRIIAMNVIAQDIQHMKSVEADNEWLRNNGIAGNA